MYWKRPCFLVFLQPGRTALPTTCRKLRKSDARREVREVPSISPLNISTLLKQGRPLCLRLTVALRQAGRASITGWELSQAEKESLSPACRTPKHPNHHPVPVWFGHVMALIWGWGARRVSPLAETAGKELQMYWKYLPMMYFNSSALRGANAKAASCARGSASVRRP